MRGLFNGCTGIEKVTPEVHTIWFTRFIEILPDNRFLENLKYFSSSMEPNWLGIVPLKEF